MTKEEAEQILALFDPAYPARFFARNPANQEVFGGAVTDADMLVVYANWADAANYNSYIQLNPTEKLTGTRCRAEDVSHWSWFVLDIDPVGGVPFDTEFGTLTPPGLPEVMLEKAESLMKAQFGLSKLHRVLIDSGRGMQAWYPLGPISTNETIHVHTEPLPRDFELEDVHNVTRELRMGDAASRVMSYWLGWLSARLGSYAGCVIDTSVSDLPRVMRLPFTINQKTGRRASIIETTSKVNESLARRLLTYAPYKVWKDRPAVDVAGGGWTAYVGHMTRGGRIFLTEGAEEPGRHRAASAAMLSLLDLGCPMEEIKAALRFGGSLCTPVLPASETDPMVERRGNVTA